MFGTSKIHGIEFFNCKSNNWEYVKIKDLKIIAILGTNSDVDMGRWNSGHCISIIFGREQQLIFNDITDINFGWKSECLPITIYLCGENNVKIPTLCAEANNYMKLKEYDEETSCMFCYLPPMTFDNRFDTCEYNHPKILTK